MPQPPLLSPTLAPLGEQPREAMRLLAAHGFRWVQLSATHPGLRPRDLDESARRGLGATLRRNELACSGIDFFIPSSHFLDAARVDGAASAARAAIELAAALGRCPLSVCLPALEEAVEVLHDLAAYADRAGVPLADHAVKPCSIDAVGVGVDPAACIASGTDAAAAVLQAGKRLVAARLVDVTTSGLRAPIGGADGRLDLHSYLAALSAAGFDRPLVIDARQWNDPLAGILASRRAWLESSTVRH